MVPADSSTERGFLLDRFNLEPQFDLRCTVCNNNIILITATNNKEEMITIGASVLDEQQPNWRAAAAGSNSSLFALPPLPQQQERVEPLRPALPSLLRAAVSEQHQDDCNDDDHQEPRRILLLQSVRDHSLAMDLAISLASAEPCRCFVGAAAGGGGRPGSSGSHGSCWRSANDHGGGGVDRSSSAAAAGGCQNCVAVTLIVPTAAPTAAAAATTTATSQHGPPEDSFPLFCRQISQNDDHPGGASTTMIPMSQQPLTLNLTEQRREANFHAQQQHALHRIQVRHASSLQDVWEYLLRVPGLPVDQQPVGGILLCGLDALVQQQQQHPHDAAAATIRMTQTGAYQVLYTDFPFLVATLFLSFS